MEKDKKIDYLQKRLSRVEKLLESEQAEKKELFSLNLELQKTVINEVSAATSKLYFYMQVYCVLFIITGIWHDYLFCFSK